MKREWALFIDGAYSDGSGEGDGSGCGDGDGYGRGDGDGGGDGCGCGNGSIRDFYGVNDARRVPPVRSR